MDSKAKAIAKDVSKRMRNGEPWMGFTRSERILHTLRDGRWHYDTELADCAGWRFGSALYEIRHAMGIGIERRTEPEPRPGKRRRTQYRVA